MNIVACYGTANMGRRTTAPKWLVIHYTASTQSRKGQARNIAAMFGRASTQASADYIVDDAECVQYNPNPSVYYCWAVGDTDASRTNALAAKYKGKATNGNCISIEMCSSKRDGGASYKATDTDWYFTDAVINNTVELARWLMAAYSIDIDHVIMHNMVSGKLCPAMWSQSRAAVAGWYDFLDRLEDNMTGEQIYNALTTYINSLPESNWSKAEGAFEKATTAGVVDGSNPRGNVTREQLAAVLDRLGLIK